MYAAAQAFADFSDVVKPSRAIAKFLSLPRWGSASREFTFDVDYLRGNALTALIPIIAGFLLTLLTLLHIILRHTCRATSTAKRQRLISRSGTLSILQIIISATLTIALTVFISLGLLGNAALAFSVDDALTVIQGLVYDLSRLGFAFLDTAILMEDRIRKFNVTNVELPPALQTSIGDQITPTFRALQSYALGGFPDVKPLRIELNVLVDEVDDVLSVIQRLTNIVYGVILAIIVLLALAPPLLFLSDALFRKGKRGSGCPHILFLVVLLLAWLLVGLAQSAGIIVSDVCVALHEYREALSTRSTPQNAFVRSGFTCPSPALASEIEVRINDTAAGVTQSELARSTVELMLQESSSRVQEAASWSGAQAGRLVDCSTQVEFSGKLEFIVCGREGSAAIEGLFDLFLAFLGLALCLHLALFVGLLGVETAQFLSVWRMPTVEEPEDAFYTPPHRDDYPVVP